jgi:hypothetical protein
MGVRTKKIGTTHVGSLPGPPGFDSPALQADEDLDRSRPCLQPP